MKSVVRAFFRVVRIVLAPVMILFEWITMPKGIERPAAAQRAVDRRTRGLALYQFGTCPFCIKARRTIRRLSLDIELRDARRGAHRDALVAGGGRAQVPCLRIEHDDGTVKWLYESDEIVRFLDESFGEAQAPMPMRNAG